MITPLVFEATGPEHLTALPIAGATSGNGAMAASPISLAVAPPDTELGTHSTTDEDETGAW